MLVGCGLMVKEVNIEIGKSVANGTTESFELWLFFCGRRWQVNTIRLNFEEAAIIHSGEVLCLAQLHFYSKMGSILVTTALFKDNHISHIISPVDIESCMETPLMAAV
ncbi:hypothetical protein LOAG_11060 [Loa loa]|uniref:Uncharacterized protein n=2 Tax=Loa loa TaxID=7209 RepID=A0A1S0TNQ5_LOALO|nr:hypothetical protein LOAG_11060 [Loa loa]EFO17438.1 hypothetical protein LOAG_11060 [Loa loa]